MTQPATVLVTTDAVGGGWRHAMEMARGLTRRGCTVTLAVLGPSAHPSQRREAASVSGLVLHPTGLTLEWLADSPAALERASASLAVLAEGVDVVLLHSPALLGAVAWPVPVVTFVHSCLTTWFTAVRGTQVDAGLAWRAEATAKGCRRAAILAVPSHAFGAALRSALRLGPVRVVHHGRDPITPVAAVRQDAVLTAGRLWDEAKGLAMLDQVAARLAVPVRAAGSVAGPGAPAIPLDHLVLLGSLDAAGMAAALAGATVFASPASYEPFGLSVLEAAQAGLALVLADIPTFRELWDGAARFVPPGDVEAWVIALTETVAAPASWAALAQRRAALYSADAMVEGTLALLAEAMVAHDGDPG